MNKFFPDIKKNFGFGLMRLPMIGEEVDMEQTKAMVDAFMAAGFNYFDTAHPYIQGKSEQAVKECLSSRYPRESYILTNCKKIKQSRILEDYAHMLTKLIPLGFIEAIGFLTLNNDTTRCRF